MKTPASTMNVSLPPTLRKRLNEKLRRQAYGSASEYVRELIRRDLQRDAIIQVDALLAEGLASPTEPVNAAWWKARRDDLARHRKERAKLHRKRA